MKVSEAKKLIGKKIEWIDCYDLYRGCGFRRVATLLEVKGRNLYVDIGGSYDWLWLPDLKFLKAHNSSIRLD